MRLCDSLELADLPLPGGRIASTLGLSGDQLTRRAVQATPVVALPASRTLGRLAVDVVNGQLTVPVQRTYALADVPGPLLISPRAPAEAGNQRGMSAALPESKEIPLSRLNLAAAAGAASVPVRSALWREASAFRRRLLAQETSRSGCSSGTHASQRQRTYLKQSVASGALVCWRGGAGAGDDVA